MKQAEEPTRGPWLCRLTLGALLGAAVGCGPSANLGGFDSDNPAAKLYAIHDAGRNRDAASIPMLVEQLDSDDPAVRVWTIQALRRITGDDLDYNPYSEAAKRRDAITRWIEAVHTDRFVGNTRPSASNPQTNHDHAP